VRVTGGAVDLVDATARPRLLLGKLDELLHRRASGLAHAGIVRAPADERGFCQRG
jgi:hypothetical protein